jgi:hypothetical protein
MFLWYRNMFIESYSLSRQETPVSPSLHQLVRMSCMVRCLLLLGWWIGISTSLTMREVDGLVYTEEEVNLERLEKHIFVWKLDLEGGVGESNLHLEALLAKRLMRESALLMQTLRSYAVPALADSTRGAEPVVRGELGIAPKMYRPQLLVREETAPRKSLKKTPDRRGGATWAGGYMEEENGIRRMKRNVFGDIMHQLFGVATDEQLQQQLRVDEELRDKVADTLTRQVYYEKELTMAVGNITMEEDRLESRVSELEQKHKSDKDRDSRMAAHRFTLMEDVDRLEDVLEAVVTGGGEYPPCRLPVCQGWSIPCGLL